MKPLFIMNIAGPCSADLLCIECTKAMSSTQLASRGKSALIGRPQAPCFLNSQWLLTVAGFGGEEL